MASRIDYLTNTPDPEFDKAVENVEALEKARAALHEDRVRNFGDEGARTLEWLERDGRAEELRTAEVQMRRNMGSIQNQQYVTRQGNTMEGDLIIGTGIGNYSHAEGVRAWGSVRTPAEQAGDVSGQYINDVIVRPNEQAMNNLVESLSTYGAELHRQYLIRNDPLIANSIDVAIQALGITRWPASQATAIMDPVEIAYS